MSSLFEMNALSLTTGRTKAEARSPPHRLLDTLGGTSDGGAHAAIALRNYDRRAFNRADYNAAFLVYPSAEPI